MSKKEQTSDKQETGNSSIGFVMPRISHFIDKNGVIHGEANDEYIKHYFDNGYLKWFVDYEDERVYLTPVQYGA